MDRIRIILRTPPYPRLEELLHDGLPISVGNAWGRSFRRVGDWTHLQKNISFCYGFDLADQRIRLVSELEVDLDHRLCVRHSPLLRFADSALKYGVPVAF